MNKDVVYVYSGILFNHKKEENRAICNMSGSWEYYVKWNKSNRKSNTIWCHLYVKSKNKQTKKQNWIRI